MASFEAAPECIQTLSMMLIEWAPKIGNWVKEWLSKIVNWVKEWAPKIYQTVVKGVPKIVNWVVERAPKIYQTVVEWIHFIFAATQILAIILFVIALIIMKSLHMFHIPFNSKQSSSNPQSDIVPSGNPQSDIVPSGGEKTANFIMCIILPVYCLVWTSIVLFKGIWTNITYSAKVRIGFFLFWSHLLGLLLAFGSFDEYLSSMGALIITQIMAYAICATALFLVRSTRVDQEIELVQQNV